jgi:hypothetical protein
LESKAIIVSQFLSSVAERERRHRFSSNDEHWKKSTRIARTKAARRFPPQFKTRWHERWRNYGMASE